MALTRRQMLVLAGTTLAASFVGWSAWRRSPPAESVPMPMTDLDAWLETLVPAEEDFPGALALGVAARVAAAVARDARYGELVRQGLAWLVEKAGESGERSFAALPAQTREAIVSQAAAAPLGSLARTFFQATLDDALFHAYADPRSWVGIGYAGPPQPLGFLDHASPPARQ
ncbi:MAG TPA: gluconate 2-dehydrogenase subunit 3 family protein [Accumulibacter sp.]|uniref:gluconate 2-dehydrogenase subunit 3 family protein n=1 Tax=Accumulibacter sp. TaxID=2053492 RepID=UPI002879FB63|nr:gluconate 2-dehydrogenase subunit 3 family protein [Accumulibacter sp.]MDS4055645.1 gluconate 2-dehydrogenase subunit 3 family protein [Accumulibacter sp.]HMV05551.1 gluconate 2-dehydrogenase subunit 3 family protein [Accumulibacter sp.]HMW65068.1 gluconate 2-dehydrogenase subunit 3 family protein [Accumulibacter sp.]HMW81916.1 gluconate 2-dehydrogenase subunit 3 family protein [Accumulibacter sp.]HMX68843.1 gluconate 2-dehydrogenase subunit 3 family protein [Accumulibacter sp.]